MRQCDRLTIRMCPPKEDPSTTYEFGATVDAWLNNGWWEGFIFTREPFSNNDNYHVFLPGTLCPQIWMHFPLSHIVFLSCQNICLIEWIFSGLGDPKFITLCWRNLRPCGHWVDNIWVVVHLLRDVLASIQSCYTNMGEWGRNMSLTSNIVGYKEKLVSCYDS